MAGAAGSFRSGRRDFSLLNGPLCAPAPHWSVLPLPCSLAAACLESAPLELESVSLNSRVSLNSAPLQSLVSRPLCLESSPAPEHA